MTSHYCINCPNCHGGCSLCGRCPCSQAQRTFEGSLRPQSFAHALIPPSSVHFPSMVQDFDVAGEVWAAVESHLPKKKKAEVAENLIKIFEKCGCSTMMQSPLWDIAGRERETSDDDT